MNERRVADEPRRISDVLLTELITEVRGFREDMAIMRAQISPLNDLAKQVYAAKLAAVWGFGILAIIGGCVTWALDVRDKMKK